MLCADPTVIKIVTFQQKYVGGLRKLFWIAANAANVFRRGDVLDSRQDCTCQPLPLDVMDKSALGLSNDLWGILIKENNIGLTTIIWFCFICKQAENKKLKVIIFYRSCAN